MATIHLMHGFIGFGKSTIAKKLATEYPAVRFSFDDFNVKMFGRNPFNDGFGEYMKRIREQIWNLTEEIISNGIDVIIDNGHWTKQDRADRLHQAKQITPNVIFHVIKCDMKVAKARTIARTNNNTNMLEINEKDSENCKQRFEPMQDDEAKNYEIIYHEN